MSRFRFIEDLQKTILLHGVTTILNQRILAFIMDNIITNFMKEFRIKAFQKIRDDFKKKKL